MADNLNADECDGPNVVELARRIVDNLRVRFDLHYEDCKACALQVVQDVNDVYGWTALERLADALATFHVDVDNCPDVLRFRQCLCNLTAAVADSQQRSWHLYDDEQDIAGNLQRLNSLVEKADRAVAIEALKSEDFFYMDNLIKLFQMEVKLAIRGQLVTFYQQACVLDCTFANYFLNSVLPTAVASELVSRRASGPVDLSLLKLLVTVLSTGEPIPYSHYTVLNEKFINCMVAIVTSHADDGRVPNAMALAAIVALNLHNRPESENTVVATLVANDDVQVFMEYVILYFNAGEHLLKQCTGASWTDPMAVLKLLSDVAACGQMFDCFYPTDIDLFFEIACREVVNLPSGDKRTAYLKLISDALYCARKNSTLSKLVTDAVNSISWESEVDVGLAKKIRRVMVEKMEA